MMRTSTQHRAPRVRTNQTQDGAGSKAEVHYLMDPETRLAREEETMVAMMKMKERDSRYQNNARQVQSQTRHRT